MAANKGEWGEPYVALHVLGNGKIYMSDENGNRKPNEWMNVLELIREETAERIVRYQYTEENTVVDIYVNNVKTVSIPANLFLHMANELKQEIVSSLNRTFDVSQEISRFLKYAEILHIKARAVDKNDVYISVEDPRTSIIRHKIGFSIKSKFGHDPTLFNTAQASAAIYKLHNMDDAKMALINSIMDDKGHVAVRERCRAVIDVSGSVQFVGFPVARRAGVEAFRENLELLNDNLPEVIACFLYDHFFNENTITDIPDVIDMVIRENPCHISRPEIKYPYMFKAFLYAAYCGMTASTLWDGRSNVNGGFITVTKTGEVLANYAVESEEFKAYLFNNCYLEFPSTSSAHGDYAYVYKQDGDYYFKLNFQIRYR